MYLIHCRFMPCNLKLQTGQRNKSQESKHTDNIQHKDKDKNHSSRKQDKASGIKPDNKHQKLSDAPEV